jgi:hypothetical protein
VKVAKERWIDDESPEGVDEGHVEGRLPTDGSDIDRPEKAVSRDTGLEGEHREGMHGRVVDLAYSLMGMDVEHRERTVRGTWLDQGAPPILFRDSR